MDFIITAQHLSIRADQERGIIILLAFFGNGTYQIGVCSPAADA